MQRTFKILALIAIIFLASTVLSSRIRSESESKSKSNSKSKVSSLSKSKVGKNLEEKSKERNKVETETTLENKNKEENKIERRDLKSGYNNYNNCRPGYGKGYCNDGYYPSSYNRGHSGGYRKGCGYRNGGCDDYYGYGYPGYYDNYYGNRGCGRGNGCGYDDYYGDDCYDGYGYNDGFYGLGSKKPAAVGDKGKE
jgi:hypothetical protein